MVAVALYETLEHMRVVGTHYRPTWMHQAYNATPSEGRHSWHYETQSPLQIQQDRIDTSDDYGPDGAVGGWASPPSPPGPHDSFGSTAGRMELQADEAGVILLQADCTTTQPFRSGPTRQSDALDSEPTNLCSHRSGAWAGFVYLRI